VQIWTSSVAWKPPLSLVEEQATVQQISDGKIRLEATARKGIYAVELTRAEAERMAELIGWTAR
jgi:hypothetical protein